MGSISNAVLVEFTKPVLMFPEAAPSTSTSIFVSLSKAARISIIIMGTTNGTGGASAITLNQAKTSGGGSSKALAFSTYYNCAGIIAGTPNDTYVATAVSSNTYNTPTTASQSFVNIIEVRGTDLDVNNGFAFVQLAMATQSNVTLTVLGLVRDIRWPDISPPTSLS